MYSFAYVKHRFTKTCCIIIFLKFKMHLDAFLHLLHHHHYHCIEGVQEHFLKTTVLPMQNIHFWGATDSRTQRVLLCGHACTPKMCVLDWQNCRFLKVLFNTPNTMIMIIIMMMPKMTMMMMMMSMMMSMVGFSQTLDMV